jgi:hypothetical protein
MQTTALLRTRPSEVRGLLSHLRTWLAGVHPRPGSLRASLPKGGLRRVLISPGSAVSCERGTLWITDAHGGEIVLEAGESHKCARGEDLLVEALAPAVFTVKPEPAAA